MPSSGLAVGARYDNLIDGRAHEGRLEALCQFQEYLVPRSAVLPSLGPCEVHTGLVTHGGEHPSRLSCIRVLPAAMLAVASGGWHWGWHRHWHLGVEGIPRGGTREREETRPSELNRRQPASYVAAPACTSVRQQDEMRV